MQLPADEEHDEQVVRVPEALKVCAALLLARKVDHDAECSGHDPARRTGTGEEVSPEEGDDAAAGGGRGDQRELVEVDHVRGDVHEAADDDRPSGGLVEGDVLVEGDDVVQGSAAEDGDEVTAHGEEDEDNVDM